LIARTKEPEDILKWELPHEFPPQIAYDGILKRQRLASVDLSDPRMEDFIVDLLGYLHAAECLLATYDFKLVVLSHTINFHFAALAWLTVQKSIPAICLFGWNGVTRFGKLEHPHEVFEMYGIYTAAHIDSLSETIRHSLATAGGSYFERRMAGQTEDIGAHYAYRIADGHVDRRSLTHHFGWDIGKRIIAVYAANWFDFPHIFGLQNFRDFLDWLRTTLDAAEQNESVNWLFKAHPCDQWYGGVTLLDLMSSSHSHIGMCPEKWNGAAVMNSVDGLVTCYGTAGVEYAAHGKPVLLADQGWYHEIGFARLARSKEDFVDCLTGEWWTELDLKYTKDRARVFAGLAYCRPKWQKNFVLQDDSAQWSSCKHIPELWTTNKDEIEHEVETVRGWFHSEYRDYHLYKMSRATEFTP